MTVSDLNKQFGSRHVLRDVTFRVREGEVLGLIGPTGALRHAEDRWGCWLG